MPYNDSDDDDNDTHNCVANHVHVYVFWERMRRSKCTYFYCARDILLLLHLECHCVSFFRMISLFNEKNNEIQTDTHTQTPIWRINSIQWRNHLKSLKSSKTRVFVWDSKIKRLTINLTHTATAAATVKTTRKNVSSLKDLFSLLESSAVVAKASKNRNRICLSSKSKLKHMFAGMRIDKTWISIYKLWI